MKKIVVSIMVGQLSILLVVAGSILLGLKETLLPFVVDPLAIALMIVGGLGIISLACAIAISYE